MTAGQTGLTTTPAVIFDGPSDLGACKSFFVFNDGASAGDALISVTGLHKTGEFFPLQKGQSIVFTVVSNLITQITAKAASTATINCGVIVR